MGTSPDGGGGDAGGQYHYTSFVAWRTNRQEGLPSVARRAKAEGRPEFFGPATLTGASLPGLFRKISDFRSFLIRPGTIAARRPLETARLSPKTFRRENSPGGLWRPPGSSEELEKASPIGRRGDLAASDKERPRKGQEFSILGEVGKKESALQSL